MRKAAVMLIIKDGKILAISRRYDKTKFGLPGGKAEEFEYTMDAAMRETREETGVQVKDCTLIFVREEPRDRPEGEDFQCYCYYALDWEGVPHNSEEGEVQWLTEYELTNTGKGAFADYNRRTLEAFKDRFPDVFLLQESE